MTEDVGSASVSGMGRTCPNGHEVDPDAFICNKCAARVDHPKEGSLCPKGHSIGADSIFCSQCGVAISEDTVQGANTLVATGESVAPSVHGGEPILDNPTEPIPTPPADDLLPSIAAAVLVGRQQAPPAVNRSDFVTGKTRDPWGVWLLSVVTLGVYFFWWYYTINGELRDYDETITVDPRVSLIAVTLGLLIEIPAIISFLFTGGRIRQAQRRAGSLSSCSGLLGVVLSLFVVGIGVVYYQSQLNKIWDCNGNPDRTDGSASATEHTHEYQALSHLCQELQTALSARSDRLVAAKKALSSACKTYRTKVNEAEAHLADSGKSSRAVARHSMGRLVVYNDRLVVKGIEHPMCPEVVATVDTAGNLSRTRRHTLTRFALIGLFSVFTPKATKHDDRELFLLLEGPDWAELIELNPDQQKKARLLAQSINLAARTSESTVAEREARVAAAREELERARLNLGDIEQAEQRLREAYFSDAILESALKLRTCFDSSPIKESWVGLKELRIRFDSSSIKDSWVGFKAASLLQKAEKACREPIEVPARPSESASSAELLPGES